MDRLTLSGVDAEATGEPRSFLFLQGPISDFFDRLGRRLIARGHRVHRVNLHWGDQLFWRLPATHYRGRFEDFRDFIGELLDQHRVTDLVVHGDRRPYHIVAAEEARARGIAVIATDLGYVRPDWITLEADGMTTFSRFPRDPAAIRALAERFPLPDFEPRYHNPFWLVAALDVAYNFALLLGRPFYPHYRNHGIYHPLAEYAGWLGAMLRRRLTARATRAAKLKLQQEKGSYFLFPLQLATDYQIRAHSPFADARDAVRDVIASFSAGDTDKKLAIIVHPLDNGLIPWRRLAMGWAERCGVADRVIALDGGVPIEVQRHAAGVVTINSTVGLNTLAMGVPVKVLGNAIFDLPGLTDQRSLDAFWREPARPEPEQLADFLRALVGTTQIKGGYYTRAAQDAALDEFVARLEGGLYPLPPLDGEELAARRVHQTRQRVAIVGASERLGVALARRYAAANAALLLSGEAGAALETAAADCRQRGAAVETVPVRPGNTAAVARRLEIFDREGPVDVVVIDASRSVLGNGRDELAAVLRPVEPLIARMRRRGRGRIALVGDGGAALRSAERAAMRQSLIACGAALAGRVVADNLAVRVAFPGPLMSRLAAHCGDPAAAMIAPDRAAALIHDGIARGRRAIALPGPVASLGRAIRLLPTLLRRVSLQTRPAIVEPTEEEALRGTGTGN